MPHAARAASREPRDGDRDRAAHADVGGPRVQGGAPARGGRLRRDAARALGGRAVGARPERIDIGAVVRDIEESFALVECFTPETNQCPIAPACVLAKTLDRALRGVPGGARRGHASRAHRAAATAGATALGIAARRAPKRSAGRDHIWSRPALGYFDRPARLVLHGCHGPSGRSTAPRRRSSARRRGRRPSSAPPRTRPARRPSGAPT